MRAELDRAALIEAFALRARFVNECAEVTVGTRIRFEVSQTGCLTGFPLVLTFVNERAAQPDTNVSTGTPASTNKPTRIGDQHEPQSDRQDRARYGRERRHRQR